ncbi:MAG: DUF4388 domain-containing protein, partial [Acidobacteriota bacterium]
MSLVGRLEELSLPEILQIVSMTAKSGRLTLSTGVDEGVVVVRKGRIIYAASTSAREAFGHLLLHLKLITPDTLAEALDRQYRSKEEKRLGAILVEMGAVSQERLDAVMHRQVWKVLSEMFEWREGFFRFRPMEIADRGEVEVDARDFLLERGIDGEGMAVEMLRRWDELRRETEGFSPASGPPEGGAKGAPRRRGALGGGATTLGALMADFPAPLLTGEQVNEVLRAAGRVAARGVLFCVRGQALTAVGTFGLGETTGVRVDRLAGLRLPVDDGSVAASVLLSGQRYCGELPDTPWNRALVEAMGGAWPRQVAVVPGLRRGKVVLLVYADD